MNTLKLKDYLDFFLLNKAPLQFYTLAPPKYCSGSKKDAGTFSEFLEAHPNIPPNFSKAHAIVQLSKIIVPVALQNTSEGNLLYIPSLAHSSIAMKKKITHLWATTLTHTLINYTNSSKSAYLVFKPNNCLANQRFFWSVS